MHFSRTHRTLKASQVRMCRGIESWLLAWGGEHLGGVVAVVCVSKWKPEVVVKTVPKPKQSVLIILLLLFSH